MGVRDQAPVDAPDVLRAGERHRHVELLAEELDGGGHSGLAAERPDRRRRSGR